MLTTLCEKPSAEPVALTALVPDQLDTWRSRQPPSLNGWLSSIGFRTEPGRFALLPGADGRLARVLAVVGSPEDPWAYAHLPAELPPGFYFVDSVLPPNAATRAALGWALGSYAFDRYRREERSFAYLVWPEGADRGDVERSATATTLVRDLVNLPACDLGPAELADAARTLAEEFDAHCAVLTGRDLVDKNYPAIYAVGRASHREPRLIELTWGGRNDPRVTLVGKGVCFDTGGLDLKPPSNMVLMKKDMGGAAHVLGLARMVMMAGLPIRLRVLIPAVDNAIAADALRPLDVIRTRKGLTVEVGDTDAEGRLILCDALTEADHQRPDLLIDFATLTGAARVALGTDLPAMFCNDDGLAAELAAGAEAAADPLWRLPLWKPYRRGLESKVADLNNVASHRYAGAIVAALFLEHFISPVTRWAHFDVMAWNSTSRAGRPEGGEAMGMRAVYAMLDRRYGKSAGRVA